MIIFYLETILDTLYKSMKGFGFNERHMNMNNRQQAIAFLRKSVGNVLTVESYSRRFVVSEDIAKNDLQELADNDVILTASDENLKQF